MLYQLLTLWPEERCGKVIANRGMPKKKVVRSLVRLCRNIKVSGLRKTNKTAVSIIPVHLNLDGGCKN
jgi:hypothetical protein